MAKAKARKNVKAKREKNVPMFAVKPREKAKPKAPSPTTRARIARIAAILERTRDGQREIDLLAKGADLSDLRHLKAIVRVGQKRPVSNQKVRTDSTADSSPAPSPSP